jgi:hypothetical protein
MSISAPDIITWFRAKAKEFNKIADTLETTFNASPYLPAIEAGSKNGIASATAEDVTAIINEKGAARVKTISEKLNLPARAVQAIITANPHLYEIADRGWIKLK